jgi:hypothetical protein
VTQGTLKRLFQEPLLHFTLLGALIFAVAHALSGTPDGRSPREIVVTEARINALVLGFSRTWRRPPTQEELRDLVREHVREEAATREAMALGIDRDDLVIRRRLRQKLEFITEDVAAREPTEAQLTEYFDKHRAEYSGPPRVAFRQVFLDSQRRGARAADDAARILQQLRAEGERADVDGLGDSRLLPTRVVDASPDEVSAQFGARFVTALTELPVGRWKGPVGSGLGLHLVYVESWRESTAPTLSEVRDAVRRDWDQAERRLARDKYYERLLSRYTITIAGSAPTAASFPGKQ